MTALSAAAIIASARKIPRILKGLPVQLGEIAVGGEVYIEHQVVVRGSEPEIYHALHTKYPHDNCDIGDAINEQIVCYCHGSLWGIDVGLKKGPARKSLQKREFKIVGETLYVTDVDTADITVG